MEDRIALLSETERLFLVLGGVYSEEDLTERGPTRDWTALGS